MEAFEQQFMQQQNRANQIFGGGAGGARQRFRKIIYFICQCCHNVEITEIYLHTSEDYFLKSSL